MAREGWHGPTGHRGPLAPQPKFDLAALGGAARPEANGQAAQANETSDRQVDQIVDRMVREAMVQDEVAQHK